MVRKHLELNKLIPDRAEGRHKSLAPFIKRSRHFRVKNFRQNRKNIKIVHLLPNVLTSFNIGCGLTAILFAIDGKPEIASMLILLAAFFDMIDGKVARFVGAASPFGIQLDSLADVISFGVTPPLLLHTILYPGNLGRLGVSLVLVYTLSTALRLARYNVQANNSQKQKRKHFTGLPCPVPACFLAASVLVCVEYQIPVDHAVMKGVYHVLTVCLACLMLSNIPYPDFSSMRVEKKHVFQYNVIMVLILCVAVLRFKIVLAALSGSFILAGPIFAFREYIRRRTTGTSPLDEPAQSIDKSSLSETHKNI